MKICFAGLGSIGQRHFQNLSQIFEERGIRAEIHAIRHGDSPLPDPVSRKLARQVHSFADLDRDYDIFFVTGPTACHAATIEQAVKVSGNLFIEKPLFHSASVPLDSVSWNPDGIYYVACPLRYSEVYRHLRENLPEQVFSLRAICSSYLPDWRPGKDYKESYSASRIMGGGVRLDLIHELDYIVSLFDMPKRVFSMSGRYSELYMDSEDLAVYLLEYPRFLAEVHLDYFGRVPRRELEIISEEEVTVYDFVDRNFRRLREGTLMDLSQGRDMYRAEMEYFLDCVLSGRKTWNEYERAYRLLELVEG